MEITIAQLVITTRTTVDIAVCLPPPTAPKITGILFSKGTSNMAARTGTVLFASLPPANVTSRVATVVATPADTTLPAVTTTLDYVANPTATFTCNDGDSVSATAIDSDIAGPSPASNTFQAVAAPPVSPPVAPVITGISFV